MTGGGDCGARLNEIPVDAGVLDRLRRKGLVKGADPDLGIFSPLFAEFCRRQSPGIESLFIQSHGCVWVDGRRIEPLSELEFELLRFLYEGPGQVCTKEELMENVYRHEYSVQQGTILDGRLQTSIYRLRAKLEVDPKHPQHILNVRGQGYKLIWLARGDRPTWAEKRP